MSCFGLIAFDFTYKQFREGRIAGGSSTCNTAEASYGPLDSRQNTMKILLAIAVLVATAVSASAQVVNYHMGTILGNGSPQGYHVGTVGIGNFNDRLSLRAATFTPWEFGEVWVGFIGEWVVPKSQKFQADLLFSLGIVGRIDGNFQPLKNLRPALSFGVGF